MSQRTIRRLIVCATAGYLVAGGVSGQTSNGVTLDQAEALIQSGRYEQAERSLRLLISQDPSGKAYYLLGFTLIQLYRYDDAEVILRTAVRLQSDRADWKLPLAKSLLEQGKNLAAIDVLDDAIAIEPQADFFYARAMCFLNLGDLLAAEESLQQSVALAPGHVPALYQLGRIAVFQGEYAKSIDLLQESLARNANNVEARYLLGLSYRRTGEADAARREFEAVLSRVPGHVGALYNLGTLLIAAGDTEEGRRRLGEFRDTSRLQDEIEFNKTAVRKNPDNLAGRLHLAGLLFETGNSTEALEQLNIARRMAPEEPEIYVMMARALRLMGDANSARRAEAFAKTLQRQAE